MSAMDRDNFNPPEDKALKYAESPDPILAVNGYLKDKSKDL